MSYLDTTDIEKEVLLRFITSIRDRMKEKKISQAYLAKETGISFSHMSEILNSKKGISVVTANKMICALNGKLSISWN